MPAGVPKYLLRYNGTPLSYFWIFSFPICQRTVFRSMEARIKEQGHVLRPLPSFLLSFVQKRAQTRCEPWNIHAYFLYLDNDHDCAQRAPIRTLQKGGIPAAPSGTATLLRLSPNYQYCPGTLLAVTCFRHPRLSWLDGRCVQGPGTYSPRHC